LSGEGSDVPCEKCHADIAAEMEAHIGPHSGESSMDEAKASPGGHRSMGNFKCFYCHSWYYTGYQHATVNGSQTIPGKEAHAASTVSCIACHKGQKEVATNYESWDPNWGPAQFSGFAEHWQLCNEIDNCVGGGCHDDPTEVDEYPEHGISLAGYDDEGILDGNCKRCHCGLEPGGTLGSWDDYKVYHTPPAGGFGLTYFNSSGVYRWDIGNMEAHMALINESKENPTLKDENEACIACHTAMAVRINWTHAKSLEFEAGLGDPIKTDYTHNWTVTEWNYNGSARATVWGNTTGEGATAFEEINWPGNVDNIYS
jgi:hypothetical protein